MADSSFKKYISFNDLSIGDYVVSSFKLVTTQYGEKIRCEIGDKVVFIPTRFIEELEGGENIRSKLNQLNDGKYWLLYRGKDVSRENRLRIEIISAQDYADQFMNIGLSDLFAS